MKLPFDLIVLDVETNGTADHRVIEIGAVRLDAELREVDRWSALIDGRPVTDYVINIHHITNEMLEGKPKFAEMHGEFDDWCAQSSYYLLAAFGAYFDMPVLREEYKRAGVQFPHRGEAFDIKPLVWWWAFRKDLPTKSLKLDRALDLLGLKFEGTKHRALPDAWNEARLLLKLAGKI